ncbi:hypothetical protein C8F04DRAFT_1189865 [Mycena alexandri]|uniref:Uncharacterized protein n=1 Tax=Mycena alexandri TaxID=1745969 RepID=A0AAD6WU22_9AGAR|nr:hypothetical protein C8F04DRAFT_1189865 [Mycena alexandri]
MKIIKALSKNVSAAGQGIKVPRAMKTIKALSTNDSGQGTKVPQLKFENGDPVNARRHLSHGVGEYSALGALEISDGVQGAGLKLEFRSKGIPNLHIPKEDKVCHELVLVAEIDKRVRVVRRDAHNHHVARDEVGNEVGGQDLAALQENPEARDFGAVLKSHREVVYVGLTNVGEVSLDEGSINRLAMGPVEAGDAMLDPDARVGNAGRVVCSGIDTRVKGSGGGLKACQSWTQTDGNTPVTLWTGIALR